jgi:DNA-binding YbaB/EbfC family protein
MAFDKRALQQAQAQAQKMMQNAQKMQEDLHSRSFEGTSGGGAVTAMMNGKFELTAIKLTPEVVDPDDVGMLEDLILAACRDAFEKVSEAQSKMTESLMGGMGLPPGFSF